MSGDTNSSDVLEAYSADVDNIDVVITAIASSHIITGILTIPLVYIIFTSDLFQAPVIITIIAIVMGAILAVSIPIWFILGWAIWSLQPWIWKIAVIVNVVFLLVNILGGIILIAMLNIILLFALYASDVRLTLTPI
ncbi:MAG: hypothetical protein ACTSU3_00420, partial [Candidatus Thorarchaeota archaeon]